jgi:hypothetical protein
MQPFDRFPPGGQEIDCKMPSNYSWLLNGHNMDNLQLKQVPMAKTGMLIRKPVADVFEAFINPDITTKFWFTKSSGRLEVGKQGATGPSRTGVTRGTRALPRRR